MIDDHGSDLGIRAPLRNRTVDLLLTIDNQSVPVSAVEPLNCSYAASHKLPLAEASACKLDFAPQSVPRLEPLRAGPSGLTMNSVVERRHSSSEFSLSPPLRWRGRQALTTLATAVTRNS
jgi:hypothetical protein